MASSEVLIAEKGITFSSKEIVDNGADGAGSSAPSCRWLRKLECSFRLVYLQEFVANLRVVLLGTKLSALFIAIPLAILAQHRCRGSPWVFALSLLGLAPLAERVTFLTEKIAVYTGSTVGGLVNATCGNVTELIIAVLALIHHKVEVVKYSLLGSILSNLLFVLGTSLFCGGIANLSKGQQFDRRQADVNSLLLLLGLMGHVLPLMYKASEKSSESIASDGALKLSRAICIVMLIAYISYLVFQLWTHRQIFESPPEDKEEDAVEGVPLDESPAIGFWSAFIWLGLMTGVVALLSEYIVATIEATSHSWGLSVSFISVILIPISGNAAEHVAAVIFAFKNKLDITLGVALGSATQIAMFVMPLSVIVSWIIGTDMGLDLTLLETSSLGLSILLAAFTLQDGTSHYIKGLVLLLGYIVVGACFFLFEAPLNSSGTLDFES